jgi:hypothetical protein
MPKIEDFALLNPVGVASSRCITADVHTRALTAQHPIRPTSTRCRSARQLNPGRRSTYRCGKIVQTTGATSLPLFQPSCKTGITVEIVKGVEKYLSGKTDRTMRASGIVRLGQNIHSLFKRDKS